MFALTGTESYSLSITSNDTITGTYYMNDPNCNGESAVTSYTFNTCASPIFNMHTTSYSISTSISPPVSSPAYMSAMYSNCNKDTEPAKVTSVGNPDFCLVGSSYSFNQFCNSTGAYHIQYKDDSCSVPAYVTFYSPQNFGVCDSSNSTVACYGIFFLIYYYIFDFNSLFIVPPLKQENKHVAIN